MQLAAICKEVGQLGLAAAGRKWDLGYDRSCWLQTRPRLYAKPKAGNTCGPGLTYDDEFKMCFGGCSQGGTGAGIVCQGKCPATTTLHGSICIDNSIDPEYYRPGT